MEQRILGGLSVSAVGLGCMGFSHAYGAPTEKGEVLRTLQAAFDMGYTMFDTAEVYGTAEDPPPQRAPNGGGAAACPGAGADCQ